MKKSFLFLFSLLGLAFANAQEVNMSNPLIVTADYDSIEARGLIGYSFLKIEDSDKPLVINYFQSYRELIPEDHERVLAEDFVWPSWGDISYTPLSLTNDELYIGRDIIFERDYCTYSHGWYVEDERQLLYNFWPDFGKYEFKNKLIFTKNWINSQKINKITFGQKVTRIPEYHNHTWKEEPSIDYSYLNDVVHSDYTSYGLIPFSMLPDDEESIDKLNGKSYEFGTVRLECQRLTLPEKVYPYIKIDVLEIAPDCKSLNGRCFTPKVVICESMTPPELTYPFDAVVYNSDSYAIVVPDGAYDAYNEAQYWGDCRNLMEASDYAKMLTIDKITDGGKCDVNLSRGQISISCESPDAHLTEIFAPDGSLIYRGNDTEVAVPEGLVIVRHAGKVSKYIN